MDMDVKRYLAPILTDRVYTFIFFASIGIIPRAIMWAVIPLDWNWDSYHHWQIAYLTLKIGLKHGRMWDLSGSEYYWGTVPHLVQALLLWAFNTASIAPYRALNVLLGGVNTFLVYLTGRDNLYWEVGLYAALLFALYPIAVVFDAIAMQETLALFLAILSIRYFRTRPFWSGVFLALASQSRIEFWLVSIIFIAGAVLVERASTRIAPFVVGWIFVTGVFCWFFATRTGNALYPLYWSLYNTIGGWSGSKRGTPFPELLIEWMVLKLRTWPTTLSGVLILSSFFGALGVFTHIVLKRWRRYHLYLFFMASLVVFGPIFLPLFDKKLRYLLLMLRMSIPIATFGSIILVYILFRVRVPMVHVDLRRIHIEKLLLLMTVLSYMYFIPAYGDFQVHPKVAFTAADVAMEYYQGGTIVCDYPTMNYRFASKWKIRATDLLGNHYSPAYYNILDPMEYARWFRDRNIRLWISADPRAYPVWTVVKENFPELLKLENDVSGIKIYTVNQTVLKQILAT